MTLSWKGKEEIWGYSKGDPEYAPYAQLKATGSTEGGNDCNHFAMSSKPPRRLWKERIAPSLLLEDSAVTHNSLGIAQPEIEEWEGKSPHKYWVYK